MSGFDTIGNATITVFDDSKPVLSTDPWLFGNPYFGSWGHKYEIPREQRDNIEKSKYIWFSHGHPDHLDPDTLKLFKNNRNTILLPDHYGDRIFNDLVKDYKCIRIKSNEWFKISKNIRIISFADWNQDATIIIEIQKKDLILNLNDGYARGWSNSIKKIMKTGKNTFLLKGIGWAPADMINIYDENQKFIEPIAAKKKNLGPIYKASMINWNCNFAIPFSVFHEFRREDSRHMAKYGTPIEAHKKGFKSKHRCILPPFIRWDSNKSDYYQIKTKKNNIKVISPDEIGDSWNDELEKLDKELIKIYFNKIDHLKNYFGSLTFRVAKKDFTLKLSNHKASIIFEVPRNSLLSAIKYNIFDDLLIGNFMKVTLINVRSLYPNFSPFVAKYADNGFSSSSSDLENYFNFYKLNSVDYWRDMFFAQSEDIFRKNVSTNNPIWNLAKYMKTFLV